MLNSFEIENVDVVRPRRGQDDVKFREELRGLRVGDLVKLTLLSATESFTGETLLVRITRMQGSIFAGRLASQPTSPCLAGVRLGSILTFTTAHIQSIPPRRAGNER
jgi:hypothetical protein